MDIEMEILISDANERTSYFSKTETRKMKLKKLKRFNINYYFYKLKQKIKWT
jgi:hypothetical protein